MLDKISQLTPDQFENLTFDLVQSAGLRNLIWRTPGSDTGRDIEGLYHVNDFSGETTIQKWYVECKRYASSIDWPTVWEKISYAENLNADFLLLVTNSNPSPACETQISLWNASRRATKIRLWRGYQMERIIKSYPLVQAKYNLDDLKTNKETESIFLPLLFDIMKISQSCYTSYEIGISPAPGLAAAAALTELISLRMDQVKNFGEIKPSERLSSPPNYDWLSWTGLTEKWEHIPINAALNVFRYITAAKSVKVNCTDGVAIVHPVDHRVTLTPTAENTLLNTMIVANLEMTIDKKSMEMELTSRVK